MTLLAAGACLALAGCAAPQSSAPQPSAPQGGATSRPDAVRSSGTAGLTPRQYASLQAPAMLRSFTPPPSARRVSVSPSARLDLVEESTTGIDKNLVDAFAEWVAPGKPADVLAEAAKQVPAQFQLVGTGTSGSSVEDEVFKLPPVPGTLNLRELDISVVAVGNDATGIRVDALAGWVTSGHAHQWVPAAARVMTLTESFKPKPVSTTRATMRAPATITNAAQVADIVSVINSLSPLPAGAVYSCPADFGGDVTLTFRARAGGPVLAAVDLPQSGCAFVVVAHGMQETSLLPGEGARDVLWRIARITGLDWATVQP